MVTRIIGCQNLMGQLMHEISEQIIFDAKVKENITRNG